MIIIWTGWTPADPILSILVSLLVLRSAWRLLKDSVNELLEGAPVSLDIAELKRRMCGKSRKSAMCTMYMYGW
ncbi:cation transporter [Escherichia coli]|uniref:cation transporter n=1 Tax=Escherichia coli TaxID=562 RepID=UPI003D651767